MARKKLLKFSALEKKLDTVFSRYVRLKDADQGGTVECVTCRKLFYWKEVDCGHFIKRQHRSTRWDERNCAPQCTRCNHFMDGRQDDFAKHILDTYGQSAFDELMTLKYQTKKHSRAEIEEKIERYGKLLERLG